MQQQSVAVTGRQSRDPRRQSPQGGIGVETRVRRRVLRFLNDGIRRGGRLEGPPLACLIGPMALDHLRRDTQQPRAGGVGSDIERGTAPEGDQERLAQGILRRIRPEPSPEPTEPEVRGFARLRNLAFTGGGLLLGGVGLVLIVGGGVLFGMSKRRKDEEDEDASSVGAGVGGNGGVEPDDEA